MTPSSSLLSLTAGPLPISLLPLFVSSSPFRARQGANPPSLLCRCSPSPLPLSFRWQPDPTYDFDSPSWRRQRREIPPILSWCSVVSLVSRLVRATPRSPALVDFYVSARLPSDRGRGRTPPFGCLSGINVYLSLSRLGFACVLFICAHVLRFLPYSPLFSGFVDWEREIETLKLSIVIIDRGPCHPSACFVLTGAVPYWCRLWLRWCRFPPSPFVHFIPGYL